MGNSVKRKKRKTDDRPHPKESNVIPIRPGLNLLPTLTSLPHRKSVATIKAIRDLSRHADSGDLIGFFWGALYAPKRGRRRRHFVVGATGEVTHHGATFARGMLKRLDDLLAREDD